MKLNQLWQISLLRKVNRFKLTDDQLFFGLTLVTGVCAALAAVTVHKIIELLTNLIGTNQTITWSSFTFGLILILVSGYITTRLFPSTSGSGIPWVRTSILVYNGRIRPLQTLAKFFTSILSLSSGLSLGREGPTVAITSGIGSFIGSTFHLSKQRLKALVAVGSAGGIAAAFNTPIAAVIFTMEEIIGDLNTKTLGSILITTVIASVVATMLHGNSALFDSVPYIFTSSIELIVFIFIGIGAAFLGPLWVKSILKLRKINLKIFKHHKLSIIVTSFVIIAALSHIHPGVLGSGFTYINNTLLSKLTNPKTLLMLLGLKLLATTVCYSSGSSGGLFLPTLFIGAMVGALIGSGAKMLFPDFQVQVGVCALVGMGAYFVSVIRAPFTSIIMIFEMTRDYEIILPLMLANTVSFLISQKLQKGSIYENLSEQDGVHLPSKDDFDILDELHVEDAMVREVVTLNRSLKIKDALQDLKTTDITGFPVLHNGKLYGMVSKSEIGTAYANFDGDKTIGDFCNTHVVTIYADQSLLVAFHILKKFHVSRLPVVSRIDDKKVIGILTAENIVAHFGFHIQEEDHKDLDEFEKEYEQTKIKLD